MPWETLDYQVFTKTVGFTSPSTFVGDAEIQIPTAVPAGQIWRVERGSVWCVFPAGQLLSGVTCYVFDQFPIEATTTPCDGTEEGVFDVAEWDPPITVEEGDMLTFTFACLCSSVANATASVRVQYAILGGNDASKPSPVAGAVPGPSVSPLL